MVYSEVTVSITILLGGIGRDSHSVGIHLLKDFLLSKKFSVKFLGIQNSPSDFLYECSKNHFDFIMMSSLDGHALLYLSDFVIPDQHKNESTWLIGGNLSIADSDENTIYESLYKKGFNKIYPKFISLEKLYQFINSKINSSSYLQARHSSENKTFFIESQHLPSNIEQLKLYDRILLNEHRELILRTHKNGHEAENLAKNAKKMQQGLNFSDKIFNSTSSMPGIQPRSGVSKNLQQNEYFHAFERNGADYLSFQIDSFTRNNDYSGAEIGLQLDKLNGYPLINHGVSKTNCIINGLTSPIQVRHSTRDPRLLAEMSFASGVTAFEGGPICYNIPYYKDYSLSDSISNWSYVDTLCSIYFQDHGIVIDREFFGTLTATLIPPSLAIAINILEMLFSFYHGVQSVSLGYAEQGNRIQDVAAINSLRNLSKKYANDFGFSQRRIFTVFHQYMAAFPSDRERARQLIYQSAITAGLSKANRILIKTASEAINIPTMEDNIEAINLVKRGLSSTKEHQLSLDVVALESIVIENEVNEILEPILDHSPDIASCIIYAFNTGLLDVPYSPSSYNLGKVKTIRDLDFCVRYYDFGKLSLSNASKDFNSSLANNRIYSSSANNPYKLIEHDIIMIAQNNYDRWPLSTNISPLSVKKSSRYLA